MTEEQGQGMHHVRYVARAGTEQGDEPENNDHACEGDDRCNSSPEHGSASRPAAPSRL